MTKRRVPRTGVVMAAAVPRAAFRFRFTLVFGLFRTTPFAWLFRLVLVPLVARRCRAAARGLTPVLRAPRRLRSTLQNPRLEAAVRDATPGPAPRSCRARAAA